MILSMQFGNEVKRMNLPLVNLLLLLDLEIRLVDGFGLMVLALGWVELRAYVHCKPGMLFFFLAPFVTLVA